MDAFTAVLLAFVGFLFLNRSGSGSSGGSNGSGSDVEGTWTPEEIVTPDGRNLTSVFSEQVRQWAPLAAEAGARFGVPPDLVLTTIHHESGGNPQAQGAEGERGLMQVKDDAVEDAVSLTSLSWADVWEGDARANILAGTAYLALQKRRWEDEGEGSWMNAVRAYMCGFEGSRRNLQCAAYKAYDRLEKIGR
jgi:soluble lytic murein transglycosylase-like protein